MLHTILAQYSFLYWHNIAEEYVLTILHQYWCRYWSNIGAHIAPILVLTWGNIGPVLQWNEAVKQIWLFLSVLCVLIKFYVISFYIFFRGCFKTLNTALITASKVLVWSPDGSVLAPVCVRASVFEGEVDRWARELGSRVLPGRWCPVRLGLGLGLTPRHVVPPRHAPSRLVLVLLPARPPEVALPARVDLLAPRVARRLVALPLPRLVLLAQARLPRPRVMYARGAHQLRAAASHVAGPNRLARPRPRAAASRSRSRRDA